MVSGGLLQGCSIRPGVTEKDQDAGTPPAWVANSYLSCWEAGIHSGGPVGAVGTAEQGPSPGDPG